MHVERTFLRCDLLIILINTIFSRKESNINDCLKLHQQFSSKLSVIRLFEINEQMNTSAENYAEINEQMTVSAENYVEINEQMNVSTENYVEINFTRG